jgi:ribosomal protein S18 acetylase RimI-like enzyme
MRAVEFVTEAPAEYKEIEFVCVNPQFPDATDPALQKKMYRGLKQIDGVVPLWQEWGDYSEGQASLSAIYQDSDSRDKILSLAKQLGVKVDLEQAVSDDYVDRAMRGEHEGQRGLAEGQNNLSYIGNCTDDDVIEHIFGDATGFAQAVEEYGDEFVLDDLVVKYDPETDVHSFYYQQQDVAEGSLTEIENMKQSHFRGGKDTLDRFSTPGKKHLRALPGGSGLMYSITYDSYVHILDPGIPGITKPSIVAGLYLGKGVIPDSVQVGSITVDENYRGRGLARALYGIVLTIMKKTLISGDSQTPGGRRNWLSLASIPGVEIKGLLDLANSQLEKSRQVDNTIDQLMQLGGQFVAKNNNYTYWAFDVVPGNGQLAPAVKNKLSKLYGYDSDNLLMATWTGGQQGLTERKQSPLEDFEGLKFRMVNDNDQLFVNAFDSSGGNELGHVTFDIGDGKELDPQNLYVKHKFRSQGIARTMYDFVKSKGYKIQRSWDQTDAGAGFWDKHRGEEERVWEQDDSEARSHDFMAGHCHVMALALKQLHPDWQIRAHVGYDDDEADDAEYRVDHVYTVAPDGTAYDCRGKFSNEQQLVGPDTTGGVDTQYVNFGPEEIKQAMLRGELKRFSKQDLANAMQVGKQVVAEGSSHQHTEIIKHRVGDWIVYLDNHSVIRAMTRNIGPRMMSNLVTMVDMIPDLEDKVPKGGAFWIQDIKTNSSFYFKRLDIPSEPLAVRCETGVQDIPRANKQTPVFQVNAYTGPETKQAIQGMKQAKLRSKFVGTNTLANTLATNIQKGRIGGDDAIRNPATQDSKRYDTAFKQAQRMDKEVDENFADGRNPQDKGDAKRHGINTKASVSSLRKTAKQGGRKGQLAHWLANMKSGRAKKK